MDTRLPEEKDPPGPDRSGLDSRGGGTSGVVHAGFWVRVAAYILDGFIIGIPVGLVAMMLLGVDRVESDAFNWAVLILTAGVVIFMWANWDGRTPGKKLLGVKVVRYPGYESLNYGHATIRYLLGYTVSILLFGLGFLMVAFREDRRGLHDLIAKTCVIYDKK